MSRIFETALFAVVFGAVTGVVIWLISTQPGVDDLELPRSLLGAFAGAFFAFLFVRLADALSKIYDRQNKNYTGLVQIQHYFNDFLNITADNIFIADTLINVFTDEVIQSQDPRIFFNRFHEYPLNRELLLSFTNIDYVNEVYSLHVELQKLNNSMSDVDRSYDQIRSAFIAKQIDLRTYMENARRTRERYREVKQFLVQAKSDIIRAFATARILANSKPPLARVILWASRSKYTDRFRANLPAEITKLEGEMKEIAEASRRKIERVKK